MSEHWGVHLLAVEGVVGDLVVGDLQEKCQGSTSSQVRSKGSALTAGAFRWSRPLSTRRGAGAALVSLAMAVLCLLAGFVGAGHATADPFYQRFETRLPELMSAHDVAGVNILVLSAGRPVWAASYGMADPAGERPMTREAVFRVESISKPVTAWGVMRLVETGRIDLDAPVQTYLQNGVPPDGAPPISVRQLLSHTGGLALGDFSTRYLPGAPRPDLRAYLAGDFRLLAPPGAGFSYSDTGFNLVELLVEEVTGEDFAAFMAREVLRPLGMATASYDWNEDFASRLPVGHDLNACPVDPYVYPGRGSGGLLATLDDVARFLVAGMASAEQRVLTPLSIATLHAPVVKVGGLFGFVAEGYGLGHFTETLSDGRRAVWHGGQGYGWMSHFHLVPETGDGIVILSNSQRAWPLIAHVLRDWSISLGVAPVGMARIVWAGPLAWGLTATLFLGATVLLLMIARGLQRRTRSWRRPAGARLVVAVPGGGLLALPLWAAGQEYLFVFSILPGTAGWLGAALATAGVSLLILAGAPHHARAPDLPQAQ